MESSGRVRVDSGVCVDETEFYAEFGCGWGGRRGKRTESTEFWRETNLKGARGNAPRPLHDQAQFAALLVTFHKKIKKEWS
jgi:hypothetical protein